MKTTIQFTEPTTLTIETPATDAAPTLPVACACQHTPCACKYVAPEVVPLEPLECLAQAAPTVEEIATAVVDRLLAGKGTVTIDGQPYPDHLGVPEGLRLGLPFQNYLTWSGYMGAIWALQDPNVLLRLAVMLTAMAKAGDDPQKMLHAAVAARDALPK